MKSIEEYAQTNELVVHTVESHTEGEVTRIVVHLPLEGETLLAKRQFFAENLDEVRLALCREPRGHRDMFCAVLTEACDGADYGTPV